MENNTALPAFIMAEHNNVSRYGLSDMVRRQIKKEGHKWVGDINNYTDLLKVLEQHPSAIVLLCVMLPGFDITTHLEQINQQYPSAILILCSEEYARIYAELVHQHKASSYIVKCHAMPNQILKAISYGVAGKPFLPEDIAQHMLNNKMEMIDLDKPKTNAVFFKMLENKKRKEIAALTEIPETTVGRLMLEINTIALQHSKYGVWGYAMLNHIVTHEMLRVVDK